MSLAIVVESINLPIWQRYPSDTLTPAVIAILVLVDVISQMNHVVYRLFADRVAVCVEETKGEITARVDCKVDSLNVVGGRRGRLGSADRRRLVGVADGELIPVLGEWFELCRLDLDRVVDIRAGVDGSRVHHRRQLLVRCNLPVQADWGSRGGFALVRVIVDGHRVVQWDIAGGAAVALDVVKGRGTPRPENHAVGVWVAGCHPVGEVEGVGCSGRSGIMAFDYFAD